MIRDKIWDVFPKKKLDKQLTRRIRKHKKILLMKHIYFSDSLYIRISAKNVSWPWLSPLWGWGSLTMTFTSKFAYIYIYIYTYYIYKYIYVYVSNNFIKETFFYILSSHRYTPAWLLLGESWTISVEVIVRTK